MGEYVGRLSETARWEVQAADACGLSLNEMLGDGGRVRGMIE